MNPKDGDAEMRRLSASQEAIRYMEAATTPLQSGAKTRRHLVAAGVVKHRPDSSTARSPVRITVFRCGGRAFTSVFSKSATSYDGNVIQGLLQNPAIDCALLDRLVPSRVFDAVGVF